MGNGKRGEDTTNGLTGFYAKKKPQNRKKKGQPYGKKRAQKKSETARYGRGKRE